jgi:hypothetical protein
VSLASIWEAKPKISWVVSNRQNYGNNASYSYTLGLRQTYHGDTSNLNRAYIGFAGTASTLHGVASLGGGGAELVTSDFSTYFTNGPMSCEFINDTTVAFTYGGETKTITGVAMGEGTYINAVSHIMLDNPGGQGYYNIGAASFDLSWY